MKLGHGDDECWYNPNNRNINTEVIPTAAIEAQPHPNPPPTRPYVPPPSPSSGRGYGRSTYQGGRPNDNTGGRGREQMPQQPGSGPMGGNMTSYKEERYYTCNELGHRGRDCPLAQQFRQFIHTHGGQNQGGPHQGHDHKGKASQEPSTSYGPTVGMVMAVTTRSQHAATKEEIPEELTFKLKEPLKALSADQWQEEKKFQSDMIDTIHDTQNDEVLPGPDSRNTNLSRDSLEDKRYRKALKNQWKGLPHTDEPTKSKPSKQMDPKTSLAKIGDKIMSTTIELTIRQLLTLAPNLFEYVHNYTTKQEAPPDKEIWYMINLS